MSGIEEKIGGLMADMRHVRGDVGKILEAMERNSEDLIIQKHKMLQVESRLDNTEVKVNGHEKIKNKAIGWVTASSMFGGFMLYLGQSIIKVFL
jgi:hypothetical protein